MWFARPVLRSKQADSSKEFSYVVREAVFLFVWFPPTGYPVFISTYKENAYNADRKRAMPEEEAEAAAAQPYWIHIRLLLLTGLGQHQPDAHKLQFEMKSQDSRGQKQMFHEKHHFHDFLYHCCLSLLAMPAA